MNRFRTSPSSVSSKKRRREKFVQLVDRYFAAGMERLIENKTRVNRLRATARSADDDVGKQAGRTREQWARPQQTQTRQSNTAKHPVKSRGREEQGPARIARAFDPCRAARGLKQLDKTVRQREGAS
jgi:type I restriction enzyme M protein